MLRRAVLIHKTPSSWQKRDEFASDEVQGMTLLLSQLSSLQSNEVPSDIVDTDIYTALLEEMTKTLGLDELHIVQGFDPGEARNWQSAGRAGYARLSERTLFFSIDNAAHLCGFLDAEVLFTRGRYPILHKALSQYRPASSGTWIHYPATSLYFPHFERFTDTWRKRLTTAWGENVREFLGVISALQSEHTLAFPGLDVDGVLDVSRVRSLTDLKPIFKSLERLRLKRRPEQKECPYDVVLCDDASSTAEVARMHPGSKVVPFVKSALDRRTPVGLNRKWDLAFCGTTLQVTKNHLLFGKLLLDLDHLATERLRIAVVGNRGNVPEFAAMLARAYQNLEIDDLGEVGRNENLDVFNCSRALLVTSGRDSNPRVIAEAAVHGARVIALDLLSDGLDVIREHPELGAVVPTNPCHWTYARNGNLVVSPTLQIAEAVLSELGRSHSPLVTAAVADGVFDLAACAGRLARTKPGGHRGG